MISRINALLFILTGIYFSSNAQIINRVNVKATTDSVIVSSVELRTNTFLIKINRNGNIWIRSISENRSGQWIDIDQKNKKSDFNALNNLRIDYYTKYDGFDNIGKLKSIEKVKIIYFDRFDNPDKMGKIKSIGNISFTYYDKFDNADNIGRLKSVGDIKVLYQDRFDGQDNIGKVKSIGNTRIVYYSRYDDKENLGKIKQIEGNTPCLDIVRVLDEF